MQSGAQLRKSQHLISKSVLLFFPFPLLIHSRVHTVPCLRSRPVRILSAQRARTAGPETRGLLDVGTQPNHSHTKKTFKRKPWQNAITSITHTPFPHFQRFTSIHIHIHLHIHTGLLLPQQFPHLSPFSTDHTMSSAVSKKRDSDTRDGALNSFGHSTWYPEQDSDWMVKYRSDVTGCDFEPRCR